MKNLTITLLLVLISPLSLGCNRDSGAPSAEPKAVAATAEATRHASPAATPGSHEDWCDEHQVPESQCTRCNPSLIAAFKATGDWCEEHGLLESQCRICNPDLKLERPPKAASK